MEVEAQAISNIDPRSKPLFSYPLNDMGISSSDLHSHDFGGSEYPDYSLTDNPKPDGSDSLEAQIPDAEFPLTVDRKFESPEMASDLVGNIQATVIDGGDALGPTGKSEEVKTNAPGGACSESSAAVKVQKVYKSYRTRRRLADSAVVAEELWWQALDFARLNHSTVSFFSLRESAALRWTRIGLNASRVGKGLSKDAKAQKLAFQHWIEAIDPRHRYGHNLHVYYEEWCKADAGQPFFLWLDTGAGRFLDLKECSRSKLRQQCIKYLGPRERENYEYIVVEGKIIHKQTGYLLDTSEGKRGTKWIFVMSTSKNLYVGEKKKGIFHHSSFLAGGATSAAGRLEAEHGILKCVSPYSGHYRPTDDSLVSFLSFLKENGVKLNEIKIEKATEDSDVYNDSKSNGSGSTLEISVNSKALEPEIPKEEEKNSSSESSEVNKTETRSNYQRTLSGGLQSPRAEVPKKAILERINSKKAAKSYQLGHQLSLKWSTGAGPRIGCVADYPVELRVQALEFVNLSPRNPPTPSAHRRIGGLLSPTAQPT